MRGEELWRQADLARARQDLKAAFDLLTQAEAADYDPDACASARWSCHMLLGDYESAWRESDAIARRGKPDPHRYWDGHPLDNRHVLIRCLHGLGDTLQYIRFAPLLRRRTRSVTLEAQPLLKALLSEAKVADRVITWGDTEPFWDCQIEIVELPRIFRVTPDSLPKETPYLNIHAPAQLAPCPNGLRVGLVWGSGPHDPARSVPIGEFAALFDAPGVCFYSLQGGEERKQLTAFSQTIPSLFSEPGDALPTAETVKSLDLIITVDTMMAHLAGALGRPVWTLLPFHCDWRWMLNREDTPWYPSMRLFRQPEPGNWRTVLQQVKTALSEHVKGSLPQPSKIVR